MLLGQLGWLCCMSVHMWHDNGWYVVKWLYKYMNHFFSEIWPSWIPFLMASWYMGVFLSEIIEWNLYVLTTLIFMQTCTKQPVAEVIGMWTCQYSVDAMVYKCILTKEIFFKSLRLFLIQNKNIEPYTYSSVYNVFYLHRYYFYNVIWKCQWYTCSTTIKLDARVNNMSLNKHTFDHLNI